MPARLPRVAVLGRCPAASCGGRAGELARQGKAIVVVTSYGPAGDVVIELDRKSLALPDGAIAVDAETGAELPRLGPGRFKLALPRHDFRVILVGQ